MSLSLENFWTPYKQLEKLGEYTNQDMKTLKDLLKRLKDIYGNFASSLRQLGERFHRDISQENHSDERTFPYYQYLGNQLLKIAEINEEFSHDVDSVIVTPYSEFTKNIDDTNYRNLEKTLKLLTNLDIQTANLKRSQEEYYKQAKNVEKSQETFSKLVDECKVDEQLQKAQDKLLKVKMDTQEAGNSYRKQIDSCNSLWKVLYSDFSSMFQAYDENEESRSFFTQNTISNLIKFFNNFNSKSRNEPTEALEDKLKEFNQKYKMMRKNSGVKLDSFQTLTSGKLNEVLNKQPVETFLSYEAKKKMDELEVIKYIEKEEYTVIYGASNEADLQFILNYTKNFQCKDRYKRKVDSDTDSTSTATAESALSESLLKDKNDVRVKIPLNEEDEKRMKDVLTNPANRKFLLDNLGKQRNPVKETSKIRLDPKTFEVLKEFLMKIFKDICKDRDNEAFAVFLPLTTKYYIIKNLQQKEYLYPSFRSHAHLQTPSFWVELLLVMVDRKNQSESLRQKKFEEIEKEQNPAPLMNKLWNFGVKRLAAAFDGAKPKTNFSDKDTLFAVLEEMCFYLSRLTQNTQIATDVLIHIGKELGIDREDIERFIYVQQSHRDKLVKKNIKNNKVAKKTKAELKWNKYVHFYLALDYLEMKDLLNLLALNKPIRALFKKKIYRTIFYHYGEQITQQQRYQIWSNVLEITDLKIDFNEVLEEYLKTNEKFTTKYDNVIKLDVPRSFTNHKDMNPQILEELLRRYALLDKDVSYCQGMNYIMGFILINLKDPNVTFKSFIRVMDWYLKALFENEFKLLKVYFFKFNRMIELYIPELATHFKHEKIDSSYFMASWFITIFASVFQYTARSQFLEKIWDFFVLDGFKAVFKTALLIIMQYREKLLHMKFDGILNFMGDIGREEIFTNIKYFAYLEGKFPLEEAANEINFTLNFGKVMGELALPNELLKFPDYEFEVFEVKLPKFQKSSR